MTHNDLEEIDDNVHFEDEHWTNAHKKLFTSIFRPLKENTDNFEQLYFPTFPKPKFYSYDTLRVEAIKDFHDFTFSINDEYSQSDSLVNSQVLNGLRQYFSQVPQPENLPFVSQTCPFCKISLLSGQHQLNDEDYENVRIGSLEYCPRCQYWCWNYLESRYIGRPSVDVYEYVSFLSKITEFEEFLPDEFSVELAQWFRRNPDRWHFVHPNKFEKLVADIFSSNYAHAEVIHVGKPDDGGIDVLFIDTNGNQWLIQVKRRENPKYTEPVKTIRNLLGTMLLEGSSYGMVVSIADHFSYRAYQAVNRAKELGMIVKLVDRGVLDRMLGALLPDRPWIIPLRNSYPDFAEHLVEVVPSVHNKQLGFF